MKLTVKVPDMTCNHCKMTINSAIQKLNEIENVDINLDTKIVEVSGKIDVQEVVGAIKDSGYTVEQILNIQQN
ncbi:MAG: heavy-metal-associated domain-containing protein [Calditrichia bacterium]